MAKETIHNFPYRNGKYLAKMLTYQNNIKSSEINIKGRVKQLHSVGKTVQ